MLGVAEVMPDTAAHTLARISRWKPALGALCAGLLLAGCAGAKDDAASLLTPNLTAQAKLQKQAELAISASAIPPGTGDLQGKGPSDTRTGGQPVAAAPPAADDKSNTANQEVYVDFQPGSVTLSDREKAVLREAVAARALSGWSRISISAARGGTGNLFDQAIVAEKRAKVVNEIIPSKMIELVEFDPTLPEDTVRLEFKRPPPAKS